jgi:hypothetical protein
MLRLVHPAPQGQDTRPSKGRKPPALYPTADERKRIRVAIRNLARAYGGYDVLAAVIGVSANALFCSEKRASFGLAVLVARAAGIPVEQLLAGRPHVAGACAVCGRKGAP